MYVYLVVIVMVVSRGGRLCLMRVGVFGVGYVFICEGEFLEFLFMEILDSLLVLLSICMEFKFVIKR